MSMNFCYTEMGCSHMSEKKSLDFRKAVKHMMVERDMAQYELGEKMGFKQKQGISQFLAKKDFKLNTEIVYVADLLGYDVKVTLIDRQSGKTLDVD